jgi:AcrR family transcriptional regulator
MIKRSVGRPKLLSREHVINTAFCEYWMHGINNVPLSKVALLAGVSRPGIYIEFTNEDELKCEVLKKYFNEIIKKSNYVTKELVLEIRQKVDEQKSKVIKIEDIPSEIEDFPLIEVVEDSFLISQLPMSFNIFKIMNAEKKIK